MPAPAVTFAESALADLEAILAWYAEQDVPDVAQRLVGKILDRVQALRNHPDLGRVVPEFDQPFLRELIHPPFRIVYRCEPERARMVPGLAQRAPPCCVCQPTSPIRWPASFRNDTNEGRQQWQPTCGGSQE